MSERSQWGTRAGFIMAAVGSAVGLGNIWRFPYVAYENGGGAFFIPYLFALLTAGIPILIMEFTIGHKYRGSAPLSFLEWLAKKRNGLVGGAFSFHSLFRPITLSLSHGQLSIRFIHLNYLGGTIQADFYSVMFYSWRIRRRIRRLCSRCFNSIISCLVNRIYYFI